VCGRFTLRTPPRQLAEQFACELPKDFPVRFNIAPTQPVAAIRAGAGGQCEFTFLRWGLIPAWADDPRIGARMINARAETVAEKRAFRAAFQHRRCLILADGYYEWKKTPHGKQPYFIRLPQDQPFALAGLWETWRDPQNNETVGSCTILTTEAPEEMRAIHPRVPVVLLDDAPARWMTMDPQDKLERQQVLQAVNPRWLCLDPVDPWVNNPQNEGPRCISPLASGDA